MSTNYKYGTGLSNVGSYQVSGKPFVSTITVVASGSGANNKIEFPTVTKEITLAVSGSTDAPVRVAFSKIGLRDSVNNYFLIPSSVGGGAGGAITLNVKATELYAMSHDGSQPKLTVFASLTGIPIQRIDNISPSGSNWSGSSGVS